MGKIFFIADTHFGSDAVRRYENRPFATVEEMDRVMTERWNSVVSPDDEVWHLGDFGAEGAVGDVLSRLNGTVYFVRGNHDEDSNEAYRRAGFREVYDLPVLFKEFFILSHHPLYVSSNMPYANIFGHVHANPAYRDYSPHHFCVSAERIDYTPIEFQKMLALIKG